MKKALTAGIVLAGIMVTGSAFAAEKPAPIPQKYETVAKVQNQRPPEPPKEFDGKRPALSRDKRPPMPPRSGDKRPPRQDVAPKM